jgi:polyisoprenoid-binding protein YceI
MKNKLSIISLFVLSVFFFSFDSVKISADKKDSYIQYTLEHKLHQSVGVSKDFICNAYYDNESKSLVKIAIAVAVGTFDSQNSSRDSHALEVLEAIKYPKVTYVSKSIKTEGDKLTISGDLDFHGVKKPMTIIGTQSKTNDGIVLKGNFEVSLDKFKVERPSMMGFPVDDNLKMEYKVSFKL